MTILDRSSVRTHTVDMTSTNDLMTVDQVAELIGCPRSTVYQYVYRKTMPEPDLRIGQSPVWDRKTIEKWNATRRTRKPKKS